MTHPIRAAIYGSESTGLGAGGRLAAWAVAMPQGYGRDLCGRIGGTA